MPRESRKLFPAARFAGFAGVAGVAFVAILSIFSVFPEFPILSAFAQAQNSRNLGIPRNRVRRPKLLVMLVIDQFRYDYLERFRPEFVPGGFNLLLGGADFVDCRYDYAITATCPGHATLFTGAYPNIHGIIGNDWYDSVTHQQTNCASDPGVRMVGGAPGPGMSPRLLMGTTVGDELRLATDFKSKVIAISLKDRAAVMPGGHLANAAYWFDTITGGFVTSSYYEAALPDWVARFNAQKPTAAYCGKDWRALAETPGAQGKVLKTFSPAPGEKCPDAGFMNWLDATPYLSEMELNFAKEAVRNEKLGQGDATDLLTLSLSANDYVGHTYGPYSPEVADMTLRTDRYLADFFKFLDQTVGLDNVWITLSADHGVAPSPAYIQEHHLGLGSVNPEAIGRAIQDAMTQAFGMDNWVVGRAEFEVYLNREALAHRKIPLERAQLVAAQAAASVPGVRAAYAASQIESGAFGIKPLERKVANSFDPRRGGDVFIVFDPFALPLTTPTGTTHGSPWNYDSQVPLIFWGSAFRPGTYALSVQPEDLAPTVAAALGVTQPSGAQGRPLTLCLAN